LIRQGRGLRSVVDVFVGQIKRHDLAAVFVNANVQFVPGAAFGAVLFKQSFATPGNFFPPLSTSSSAGLNRQS
jgi:hypothetical protein